MQKATVQTVLGNFSNVTVNFHNITSRFYQEGEQFLIDTLDDAGKAATFVIQYTFGYFPLQQYLIETQDGHIQALNIAWDSRKPAEGGQRWFHLQPEEKITPDHPFYWSNHFQNWNSRCADCHSTNVVQNYDAATHSYNTSWSEINVACEACHGPGAKHITMAQNNTLSAQNTGFTHTYEQSLDWTFEPGKAIAKAHGEKRSDDIAMCGRCHSLRAPLTNNSLEQDFHNNYRLQLLNERDYFADGQIREEVFVLGSFLQSKMYKQGVTCGNCHNPHSGKLLIEGNALCSQCHQPNVFDTKQHHHHATNSQGAACVNCHMPARTYMQVDDRRDHSFTVPRPDLSQTLGVPNACVNCHQKLTAQKNSATADKQKKPDEIKDNRWASTAIARWRGKSYNTHWSSLNHRIHNGDVSVTQPLATIINDNELTEFVRASLLQQFAATPTQLTVKTAQQSLQDSSPLVRRAAVTALAGLPAQLRWQLLAPHLHDKNRSVRHEIAQTLADVLKQLPSAQQTDLANILNEHRESLSLSLGSPITQTALANLEIKLGNPNAALTAYLQALRIESNYVPAMINLADYYRSTGNDGKAEPLLKQALSVAPDSGAAHHSYGLLLTRKQDYTGALRYLHSALQQADASARYAYVYAVALDSTGKHTEAIDTLIAANKRWPNDFDVLITLVAYLDKSGKTNTIPQYLTALKSIAPHAPQVQRLLQKYRL